MTTTQRADFVTLGTIELKYAETFTDSSFESARLYETVACPPQTVALELYVGRGARRAYWRFEGQVTAGNAATPVGGQATSRHSCDEYDLVRVLTDRRYRVVLAPGVKVVAETHLVDGSQPFTSLFAKVVGA